MAKNKILEKQLFAAARKGHLHRVKRIVKRLIRTLSDERLSSWQPGYELLCKSLRKQNVEIVKFLISQGCMISAKYGVKSALHLSILYGDVEIVKMVIERWYLPNQENSEKMSLLHTFAQRKPVDTECEKILTYLLKTGNINIQHQKTGFMPIHFAAECDNTDMVTLLIKNTALINGKAKEKRSPLHIAALNGNFRTVITLLKQGAIYSEKDSSSKTALCLAVQRQDMRTIKAFLHYSSNVNTLIAEDDMLIYCACETLNKPLIEMLLRKGGDPNKFWKRTGKFPLHLVVERRCKDIVELLLKYGANPNVEKRTVSALELYSASDSSRYTPLHLATEMDHFDIFNYLLDHGAQPNAVDEQGQNPLHLVTENGSLRMASILLNSKCEVDSFFTFSKINGYTPLHIAVANGNKDLVKHFIDKGVSVDSTTSSGYTSLHIAIQSINKEMVQLLLKYNANPSSVGPSTVETPLFLAAKIGSFEIVELLSEATMDRRGEWIEGFVSLYISSFEGHENIVEFFLQKGVSPNSNFHNFLTPLHAGAQQGHIEIIKLLLNYKAEVNPRWKDEKADKPLSTPLLAAVLNGDEEIVEILLNRGADVKTKVIFTRTNPKPKLESLLTYGYESHLEFNSKVMKPGYTALHFAAERGKKAIIDMLINRGADLNSTAKNGTPLSIAVENQHEEIVARLLQAGAYASSDASINPAFCTAIVKKNAAIVELLLKSNFSINFTICVDNISVTPLQLAIIKSSAEVIKVLLSKASIGNLVIDCEILLHYAIEKREDEIVRMLIENGACVNSVCIKGLTPLFHAVKRGKISTFKLLLEKGASFEMKTSKGLSLLHYALGNAMNDMNQEMIEMLVNCGANVNETNVFNISPVERIFNYYNQVKKEEVPVRLFNLFLTNGLDVNTKMLAIKKSVLHYACHMKSSYIVESLLHYGSNVNVLDGDGKTAFQCSLKNVQSCLCKDSEVTEKQILRLLTQSVAKLEACSSDLHPNNIKLLSSRKVIKFYKVCKKEIQAMKETLVIDKVSYFDVISASKQKIISYARNINIVQTLNSSGCVTQFPLYYKELQVRINRAEEIKDLLGFSNSCLREVSNLDFPEPVAENIFQYLELTDLKNLCRMYDVLNFVTNISH